MAQGLGHHGQKMTGKHAHEHIRRISRIGQGADHIEQRAHAELFANRADVAHGRVVVGREHKAHACLGNALRNLVCV